MIHLLLILTSGGLLGLGAALILPASVRALVVECRWCGASIHYGFGAWWDDHGDGACPDHPTADGWHEPDA